MEARRHRVAALIRAGLPQKDIAAQEECFIALVKKVAAKTRAGEDLARKNGSGGHNKVITDDFKAGILSEVTADPMLSQRKLAKELDVAPSTVRKAVKELGLTSYRRQRQQLLTDRIKVIRVEKGKRLLNQLKKGKTSSLPTVIIFSDKKLWTVDEAHNSQNSRFLAYCIVRCPESMRPSTQHRP